MVLHSLWGGLPRDREEAPSARELQTRLPAGTRAPGSGGFLRKAEDRTGRRAETCPGCGAPAPGRPQRVPGGAQGARVSGAGASVRAGPPARRRGRREVGVQKSRTHGGGGGAPAVPAARVAAAEQQCAAGSAAAPLGLSPAAPTPLLPAPSLSGAANNSLQKKKKSRIGGAGPQDPSSLGAPHPSPPSPASPPSPPRPPSPHPRRAGARLPPSRTVSRLPG